MICHFTLSILFKKYNTQFMQDNTKSPIGSLCFSVSIVIVMLTEAAIQCPHRCKLASPHSMDDFTLSIYREQGAGR